MNEDIRQVIGGRMKQAAKEAGLSADEVARRVGVAAQTIYGYWSGARQPDLTVLTRYADAVGVEPGWFFDPGRQRVERAEDLVVRILNLTVEGMDFGKATEQVIGGRGTLSPRERRMVSAGTEALRSYVSQQEGWDSLPPEGRLRVLRQIVAQAQQAPDGA